MTTASRLAATILTTMALTAQAEPLLHAADEVPTAISPRRFHVLVANPKVRQRVELALQGAAERLTGSECQKVFTDFRDGAGQPLQSRLNAVHQTGAEFLTWLRFAEGEGRPLCAQGTHVAAFTQPGSRVVQVCGAVFARQAPPAPQAREMLMIHELLHTLGLEENPPSSAEISRQVLARCGSQNVQRKPI